MSGERARGRTWRWRNLPVPEPHLALITVGVVAHVVRPWPIGSGRSMRRIGWPLVVTGAGLAVWATREAGATDMERPDRVVTSGPYSFSRHPMYVAWTCAFVGVGLARDSAWLIGLLPPLVALVHRAARIEETRLTAAFGADYLAYRDRVRRYL